MSFIGLPLSLGTELLAWVSVSFLFILSLFSASKYRMVWRQQRKDAIILELTPPPYPHNTLLATEEFFKVLCYLVSSRSWRDLVNGRKATIALEVVSTRKQGIRYLVRIPRYDLPIFLHNLAAFAPTVTAEIVSDYMKTDNNQTKRLLDFRQTGQRRYALKHNHSERVNDPIAYVTNAISQLENEELIALQIVLSPASDWNLSSSTSSSSNSIKMPSDLVAATLHKKHQPLFQTSVRVLVQTSTKEHCEQRIKGIRGAFAVYSFEGYQSLRPRLDLPGWTRKFRFYAFRNRLPALYSRNACLLASSELGALYHFPFGTAAQTEDLKLGRPNQLPVPLAVKNQSDIDVFFGENNYRGRITRIGVSADERKRHAYIVGGTGNGKSTLLQQALVQDIRAGKGIAVIDPHGDLAASLLEYIPENRIDDVIYFNPSDIRYPIGLNLLELTSGLDEMELLQEKDLVTESIVSMFRKIFSTNDTSGHRIEYVLRNAVQTVLTLERPTLFTVYDLLNDPHFRKRVVLNLENEDLKLFWREFNRAGSYQQVSMAAGITAKIGRFLFSASARQILEQPQSTINIDDIMREGKILICNLSKGQVGEDTSELFGIMILAKLQLAALRRANLPMEARRPFYVYVDEFQNFATISFVQLLSEARKYGLFLTMAEQSTSQQSDRRLIDIVFANVGTIISFRTSSLQDERLIQPLLGPFVQPGTLSQLPAYSFYIRIAATFAQQPFSGQTVLMSKPGDKLLAQLIIQASRMKYGKQLAPPAIPPVEVKKESSLALQLLTGGST